MTLDDLINTKDPYFNEAVYNFIKDLKYNKNPNISKQPAYYAELLHKVYFWGEENRNRPFGLIETIKGYFQDNHLNNDEITVLLDKYLGMAFYLYEEAYQNLYFELMDWRDSITPFDANPEYMKLPFTFNVDEIKETLQSLESLADKELYLVNLKYDFEGLIDTFEDLEAEYYESYAFEAWIKSELDRIAHLKEITPKADIRTLEIVQKHKTDIIRVLDALHQLNYLQTEEGLRPTKKQFFECFGQIFKGGLNNYDKLLSQSKDGQIEAHLKVFDELKNKAKNSSNTKE